MPYFKDYRKVSYSSVYKTVPAKFPIFKICGEGGIRTLDPVKDTAFPRRRTRPLCDLSELTNNL